MGLSSTQARLGQLTIRDHDITCQKLKLSNTLTSLNADMLRVSSNYQKSLSAKKMQLTFNNGVTTSDISYGSLMRPNANNMKSPTMLTNASGKIVVDSKYKKYAEMVSPNGQPGGSYEGDTRIAILSGLTGISQEDLKAYESMSTTSSTASTAYSKAQKNVSDWLNKETSKTSQGAGSEYLTAAKLAKKMGKMSDGTDLASLYNKSNGTVTIKNENGLKSLINTIKNNLGQYFVDDEDFLGLTDKTKFKKACDDTFEIYKDALKLTGDKGKSAREALGIEGDSDPFIPSAGKKINIKDLFNSILDKYDGSHQTSSNDSTQKTYLVRYPNTDAYKNWHNELEKRMEAFDSAADEYDTANDAKNQALTAEQESLIGYYDDLFAAIVDNGWVYDSKINDNDYLNQTLQNNTYYFTTMHKNSLFDPNQDVDARNYKYDYVTDLASNFDKIVTVNDSEAVNKALVQFEDDKRKINDKEKRINLKMEKLNTEQSAIKQMMESMKKIKNENIERTMNLFA